jgi:hypothetical protein
MDESTYNELTFHQRLGRYEGEGTNGQWVSVSVAAMDEARRRAALDGESEISYIPRLLDPDEWLWLDPTLQDIAGVDAEGEDQDQY